MANNKEKIETAKLYLALLEAGMIDKVIEILKEVAEIDAKE